MRTGIAVLVAGALFYPLAARADVVVLDSIRDNTLYEDATGSKSNGAGNRFFSGQKMNGIRDRGLIKFDIAGNIPLGAGILSATLQLNMTNSNAPASTVSLHPVLADWGEGTSDGAGTGAPSTTGDATWLHTFFDTSFWANVGGDFAATASASQTVDTAGFYTWDSTPDMVADVQGWLDNPATNFGWIVVGTEFAGFTDKAFATREHATVSFRPQLTVEFTVPPIPSSSPWGLLGLASMIVASVILVYRHRRFALSSC